MKANNLIAGFLLFTVITQFGVSEAKTEEKAELELQKITQETNMNQILARDLFLEATDNYCLAQATEESSEKSELFARAINDISKAIALEPDNSDYLLLGSQIWRAKGGISYAKSYFSKAEKVMLKKLDKNPDSIAANMDYAIACYAGDIRFGNNYAEYKVKAEKHAKKTIELCQAKLKQQKNSDLLIIMAMANLILQKQEKCQELLLEAKKIEEEESKRLFSDLPGNNNESAEDQTIKFYYSDLFDITLAYQQWFWEVSKKNVDKEFLLYYMTDITRYYSL